MLSWIRSWWGRPTETKKKEPYEGLVITVRNADEKMNINANWYGTAPALTPNPHMKK
jgi:hypothetical protein